MPNWIIVFMLNPDVMLFFGIYWVFICACNLLSAWSRFFCAMKIIGGDRYGTDTSD